MGVVRSSEVTLESPVVQEKLGACQRIPTTLFMVLTSPNFVVCTIECQDLQPLACATVARRQLHRRPDPRRPPRPFSGTGKTEGLRRVRGTEYPGGGRVRLSCREAGDEDRSVDEPRGTEEEVNIRGNTTTTRAVCQVPVEEESPRNWKYGRFRGNTTSRVTVPTAQSYPVETPSVLRRLAS